MVLLETTKNLNQQNSQLTEEKNELAGKNTALEESNRSSEQLYKIFNLINKKDLDTAKQQLEEVDASDFSGEKLVFYNYLKDKLNEN